MGLYEFMVWGFPKFWGPHSAYQYNSDSGIMGEYKAGPVF